MADASAASSSDNMKAKYPSRPTSKDYAAKIQRLELERLKLQTQPISLPVVAMNAVAVAISKSEETTRSPAHGKGDSLSQTVSPALQLSTSRSTPELRINLETIKADMQQDKYVVKSIQDQLSHRSVELNSVRSQLLMEKKGNPASLVAHQMDHYSGDVSEEQRIIADLKKQLEQQAQENVILKQQVPARTPLTLHIPVSSTRPSSRYTNSSTSVKETYTNPHLPPSIYTAPPQLSPPNLVIPSSRDTHTDSQSSALPLSHSPQSQDGTSLSISPQSSFTSVTNMSSSSVSLGRRVENSKDGRVLMVSAGPPANLDGQKRSSPEKSNEIHLQRRLDQSQTQVTRLKDRLQECNDICEQQKVHFRDSIAELQVKLKETIVGRDSVLDLRKKEAEGQEHLIDQLQQTLKELEADYRLQQEASRDSKLLIDSLQQNLSNTTAALNQINILVTKEAGDRGLTLLTVSSESPLATQRPALVVTSLQQLLRHYEGDVKDVKQRAMNSGKELEDLRQEFNNYKLKISEEHRCKLNQLSEEHEKQMNTVTERALNARQQATGLQAQLSVLQEQIHQQVEAKNKHVSDLEQTIVEMQQQTGESRKILEEKCQSLSDELDDLTDHHRTVSRERDELVSIVQGLEQELAETKDFLATAEADADEQHVQNEHVRKTKEETSQKCNDLMGQLEKKLSEVEELKKSLADAKEEAKKQIEEKMSAVEIQERQRSSELTGQLSAQVSSLTQKCTILSQELDQKETILHNFKQQQDDTFRNTEDQHYKLQIALAEKTELAKLIEDKERDVEIIKQERDHYFALLEERNKELGSLCSQQEKLVVQISERERQVMAFREQSTNMTHLVEISSKSSSEMKEDKARLQQLLEEQKLEANSLKIAMEGVERRMKMKERKVEELDEENKKLMEEVEVKMREMEDIIESKEKMLTELREAKLEVDAIAKDNERLRLDTVQGRRQFDKERNKLTSKVLALEYELAVTTKAIHTTNTVDAKAVRVAETMQKKVTAKRGQIDSLQSKIHWLEERLDAANKEKSAVIGEKDKMQLKLDKLSRHNHRLNADVTTMLQKRKAQKSVVRKLETALEKAALKHSEVQAYIEMQEQDMARLRLRHQLEIKEIQRSSAVQNATRPNMAMNKPYHTVPSSTTMPSISSVPIAKETKTQAVQTTGTVSERRVSKEYAEKEYMYSALQPFTQESNPPSNGVNQEMKALLSQMKNVLNTATDTVKQQGLYPLVSSGISTMPSRSSTHTKVLDPPIHTSSPYKDITISSTPPVSGMPHSLGPLTALTSAKLAVDVPPSPVANLLGRYDRDQGWGGSRQDKESSEETQDIQLASVKVASTYQTKRTRHRRLSGGTDGQITEVDSEEDVSSVTSVVTPDLDTSMKTQQHHIEELEEQLKVLSKIGGQLQQENKEMASLIKSQDVKLKRCRQEERSIKSLVSTTKH